MTVLVSDSFNRANNTTLGSTDSYNGGTAKVWQYSNTPFGIDANQAYLTSGTNGIAYVDAGVSDCDITVTLSTAHTFAYSCVSARIQDASNQISLQYDGTTWYMYKQVSGAFTQLASNPFTATDGDIIKVRLNGTSISVFMNGSTTALMSGTTASFQTLTNHGLQPANTNNRYDNFQIDSLSTGGTVYTSTLSDSVSTSETLSKTISARKSESITLSDSLSKGLSVSVIDTLSTSDGTTAQSGKAVNLTDSIAIVDAISKSLTLTRADSVVTSESERESTVRSLFDTLTQSDAIIVTGGKAVLLSDSVTITDSLNKALTLAKLDSLGLTDSIGRTANTSVRLYDVVVTTETFTKSLPNAPVIIGTIELNGDRTLYVYLTGSRNLDVILRGGID